MQFHDASAVTRALPFDTLVNALRDMFARGCSVPARHVHTVDCADGTAITSLLMPAWADTPQGSFYGLKVINVAPGNPQLGLPGLHASYLLHDAHTGVPLALMDGNELTARRTAAASALAATWLSRADARHLLVVGAGRVAALLPAAYRAVRPIEQVTLWARNPEAADALAARWRTQGFVVAVAPQLRDAVATADIISCATLATEPLIQGDWLAAGSHLDLIGSFTPAMREADETCFAGASVHVDTEEALSKSGDLLVPLQHGVFKATDVRSTLAALAQGSAQGRQSATERTVFKSVGTALEDLAAALLVHAAAQPNKG